MIQPDISRNWYIRHREFLTATAIVVCTILAMALRRPDQMTAPTLWGEDGLILPDFAHTGWLSVFHPLNGYLLLPSRLILAIATTLSFRWLPEISYWIALAFSAAVLITIALSPTQLKARTLCALSILVLPLNSEVYAASEYAFWWGSLLALLPLFWRDQGRQNTLWRAVLILIGGLSSPLVAALVPLYFWRAIRKQRQANWSDFGVALFCAFVQVIAVLTTHQARSATGMFAGFNLTLFMQKFFGYFVYLPKVDGQHEIIAVILGFLLMGTLAIAIARSRAEFGGYLNLLVAACILSMLLSIMRVPIAMIHPSLAGPRYFFFPFTLLSWVVLQLAFAHERGIQFLVVAVFALSIRNALDIGQRRHDPLDWRASVQKCTVAEKYDLPVHTDGHASTIWSAALSGNDCRRLVRQSWFDNTLSSASRE